MLSPQELTHRLAQFPRLQYGRFPTPLEFLPNFSQQLGQPVWIKRDDGIGPAMGGNKGRKLEFLMAEVLAQDKKKVVTYGGLQSNHARMTAAACAALGLQAHLFFFAPRPSLLTGNLLLNHLLGAKMHFIPFGGGSSGGMTLEQTNQLVRLVSAVFAGPRAYFMPVGGHTVTGCLGYVNAAIELHQQVEQLGIEEATVITAVGTGGTLAGLMAGFHLLNSPLKLLGIDVGKLWKTFPVSIARLASQLCAVLGQPHTFQPTDVPMIERTYVGPGYAVLTNETTAVIHQLAHTEGIILDPVYSGKAAAGMVHLARNAHFPNNPLIFLHTGGFPGLWAYEAEVFKGIGEQVFT